jgi:hypothetical protein
MRFQPVIEALEEFCEKQQVKFALVGAFGLAAYGLQRNTRDLDLLLADRTGPLVGQFLESLGYETLQSTQAFSIHSHPLREMGRVDLILVDDHTASQVFGRARTCSLQGKPVLVPCPEHLAAMKAAAIAQQPKRTLKDLADVQFLLTLPGVDREEIRRHFEQYHLEERYDEVCRILDAAL